MLLSIRHVTTYEYDPAAEKVALRLKLFPAVTAGQTPQSWSVTVNGEATQSRITNGFGDDEALWIKREPVSTVEVIAEGVVETRDVSGVLRGWPLTARPAVFLRETPLTRPDASIRDLAMTATDGLAGLESAHALAAAVREAVAYDPTATTAETPASEALKYGSGVCQDHAHVLIAASRSIGAAARYVVGYLHVGAEEEGVMAGHAETHAWVEIWIDGLGWVGFDATNGICPTDRYVRLASGLDAPDAAPIRGAVTGVTHEDLTATVQVIQSQQ